MMRCKKILMYNPAISSLNLGDHIIYDAIKHQLNSILEESFVVDISTHLPVSSFLRHFSDFDYKFVCGSNLLRGKMNRLFKQWDINIFNAHYIGSCILVGAGWWQYNDNPNYYTKQLYRHILSKDFLHSVRDSYTFTQMKKMGFDNVINTACPSMWYLTKEHCAGIPTSKGRDVVCTITDYNEDFENDTMMIKTLNENYRNVFLWLQGSSDFDYFKKLDVGKYNVKIVPPVIAEYDNILSNDVDYVGTRLHAGIRALQMKKRTIIVAIDNRAIEKQKDFNINCISRGQISELREYIYSNLPTNIHIPEQNIKLWLEQFPLE